MLSSIFKWNILTWCLWIEVFLLSYFSKLFSRWLRVPLQLSSSRPKDRSCENLWSLGVLWLAIWDWTFFTCIFQNWFAQWLRVKNSAIKCCVEIPKHGQSAGSFRYAFSYFLHEISWILFWILKSFHLRLFSNLLVSKTIGWIAAIQSLHLNSGKPGCYWTAVFLFLLLYGKFFD